MASLAMDSSPAISTASPAAGAWSTSHFFSSQRPHGRSDNGSCRKHLGSSIQGFVGPFLAWNFANPRFLQALQNHTNPSLSPDFLARLPVFSDGPVCLVFFARILLWLRKPHHHVSCMASSHQWQHSSDSGGSDMSPYDDFFFKGQALANQKHSLAVHFTFLTWWGLAKATEPLLHLGFS